MRNLFFVLLFVFGFDSVAYARDAEFGIRDLKINMQENELRTIASRVCKEEHNAIMFTKGMRTASFSKCYTGMFITINLFYFEDTLAGIQGTTRDKFSDIKSRLTMMYGNPTKDPFGRRYFWFADFRIQIEPSGFQGVKITIRPLNHPDSNLVKERISRDTRQPRF